MSKLGVKRLGPVGLALATMTVPALGQGLFEDLFGVAKEVVKAAEDVVSPATALSEAEEIEVGAAIAADFESGVTLVDGAPLERCERLLAALVPHVERTGISYAVKVIQDSTINAYSFPGGHIYLPTGMVEFAQGRDAELMAILGHEVGHVDLGHCAARIQNPYRASQLAGELGMTITSLAQMLVTEPFHRDDEFAADSVGVVLMKKAGKNPQGAVSVQARFAEMERAAGRGEWGLIELFRSTHPQSRERKRRLEQQIGQE